MKLPVFYYYPQPLALFNDKSPAPDPTTLLKFSMERVSYHAFDPFFLNLGML